MAARSEGVNSPLPRLQSAMGIGLPRPASGVLRVLLGIGGGLSDYDRRRPINANAPKPTAQSESAEGSGN